MPTSGELYSVSPYLGRNTRTRKWRANRESAIGTNIVCGGQETLFYALKFSICVSSHVPFFKPGNRGDDVVVIGAEAKPEDGTYASWARESPTKASWMTDVTQHTKVQIQVSVMGHTSPVMWMTASTPPRPCNIQDGIYAALNSSWCSWRIQRNSYATRPRWVQWSFFRVCALVTDLLQSSQIAAL
jgi:hypothetical protein